MKFIISFLLFATTFLAHASNILFIGDSHTVGPFGRELDALLRSNGHSVTTYGVSGSIGSWWLTGKKTKAGYFQKLENGNEVNKKIYSTPNIEQLLKKPRDIVIVSLGTNYSNESNAEFIKYDIKNLLSKIKKSGADCFWVGPPDSRLLRRKIENLYKVITPIIEESCFFYDSLKITHYPAKGGDGIQFLGHAIR